MIFDGHSDLFLALYDQYQKGKSNVIDNYYEEMLQSQMMGGIFVMFLDDERRDYENFEIMYNVALKEIKNSLNFMLVKDFKDLITPSKKIKVIMGAESLAPIQYDLSFLKKFYDKGLRHAMLTWNEENELATGVKGRRYNGVTDKGFEFLDKMQELRMIIDLSHMNERSFYDAIDYVRCPVICSHSNCYSLCEHPRNLKDRQLMKIKEKKGLVSVTAVPKFISEDPEQQNVEGLVDHIDYIVNLIGIDYVALGFDYMGFYGSNEGNLKDMYNFSHSSKIIDALIFRGYEPKDIEKITYKNYLRVIEEIFNRGK